MSSELSQYYHQYACQPSCWAHENPERCGCRGRGFFLSDVDTWHRCPIHGADAPHPDSYFDVTEEEMEEQMHEQEGVEPSPPTLVLWEDLGDCPF